MLLLICLLEFKLLEFVIILFLVFSSLKLRFGIVIILILVFSVVIIFDVFGSVVNGILI